MKNKTLVTTLLAFIASSLFYEQTVGLNFVLFNAISVLLLRTYHKKLTLIDFFYVITPTTLTSFSLMLFPQTIAYIFYMLFYVCMWTNAEKIFKPILVPVQGFLSMIESHFEKKPNINDKKITESKFNFVKKYGLVSLVSGVIFISFLILYSKSNPLLGRFIENIDLSFIELQFLLKTGLIYLLLFGLLNFKSNKNILKWNSFQTTLTKVRFTKKNFQEYQIVFASFLIISVLLTVVNLADVFVFITGKLPENLSYSSYLHQGFNSLIFSIVLSIALVLYFYRGAINFFKNDFKLNRIATYWIFQNLLLALITGYKNIIYIKAYGLTYKRCFVFVCLLFVFLGLIYCMEKIKSKSTNWKYFNDLGKSVFIVCIFISVIPYDYIITNVNTSLIHNTDYDYLLRLNQPDLKRIRETLNSNSSFNNDYYKRVERKIELKNMEARTANWLSWNFYTNSFK